MNNIEHAQELIRNEILWISVHLILGFAEKSVSKANYFIFKILIFFVAFFITILTIMSLKDLSNIKGQLTPVQLLHYKYMLCSFKTFAKFSNFQILKLPNLLAIFLVFSQRFFKGAIMSECWSNHYSYQFNPSGISRKFLVRNQKNIE